ncbi:hypothetical protein [Flavisolibacter tropicus]|uniref:O-antigen polymerase n=1 Tax=Flavisolibacter tropicus TaxID=1492898 RepID=A0A172TS84_9BACT|nr:hypothetical protein [Flavisolibacter tropicus]ANE49623.1 hypothetical protein SY85_02990 [Flavisolibacter tropicus]
MIGAILFIVSFALFSGPNRFISIVLLFALLTGGFQLVPLNYMVISSIGVTKCYDWVLLFVGAMLLLQPQVFLNTLVWKSFKMMSIYGVILIILLVYSIFVQNVEPAVSVRVFRNLLYFLPIVLFVQLPQEEIAKVFKILIFITAFVSLVYCLQQVFHKTLLNGITSDFMGVSGEKDRYYNLPVYVYPVIFFLFFKDNFLQIRFRYILLLMCCSAVLLSQHRNLLLAIVVCYFLHFLFSNRVSIIAILGFSILSAGFLYFADSLWNNRFSKGLEDISQTSFAITPAAFYEIDLTNITTTEFRQYLFQERLNYILKENGKTLLGAGLITDDSRKAASLNFNIGMDDGYGNVSQVASSDIAWSSMILQMGVAGTLVFILFHISFLKDFFKEREDGIMQVGALYIIALFITSFFSNTISLPYTTSLLVLFGAYYYQLYLNKRAKSYLNDQDFNHYFSLSV